MTVIRCCLLLLLCPLLLVAETSDEGERNADHDRTHDRTPRIGRPPMRPPHTSRRPPLRIRRPDPRSPDTPQPPVAQEQPPPSEAAPTGPPTTAPDDQTPSPPANDEGQTPPPDDGEPVMDPALGPPPGPEDVIVLANRRRLPGIVLAGADDDDRDNYTIRTRSGVMVLPKGMVTAIERSFENRRRALAADDYQGHLELARWALAKDRKVDALALLEPFADSDRLDLEGLRLLATLIDELHNPARIEEALALYRRYRAEGGRDRTVLDRLKTLENILNEYQAELERVARLRAEHRVEDGYEVQPGWASEDPQWANRAHGKVVDAPSKVPDRVLAISAEGGEHDKAALKRRWQLDVSTNSMMSMQAYNDGDRPVQLSVAVKSGDDWQYFESRPYDLPADKQWHTVTFDLLSKDFKSEASNWAFKVPVADPTDLNEVQLLVWNGRHDSRVFINDLGFNPRTGPGPEPDDDTRRRRDR